MSRSVCNNNVTGHGVVVNNINPSTREAETGQSLNSRQESFTMQVQGFQGYTEKACINKPKQIIISNYDDSSSSNVSADYII